MAIYRQVHVSFWQDNFILDLTPEEKYFYLYLMTNGKTRQCGVYELHKKVAEIETGYNRETVEKLLERFVKYGKIRYNEANKEILLVNWLKYNGSKSPTVLACIRKELATIKTPEFLQHCTDILSIQYPHSMGSVPIDQGEEEEKEEEQEQEQQEEKETHTSADAAECVMAAYNEILGDLWKEPLLLTSKRRKHINARLKRFTLEQLRAAMKNLRADPWNTGQNPNKRVYATPDYLFRSDDQVDIWLNKKGVSKHGGRQGPRADDDDDFYRDVVR